MFASPATFRSGAGHLSRSIRIAQNIDPFLRKFHIGRIEIDWLLDSVYNTFELLPKGVCDNSNCLVVLDSYDSAFCQEIRNFFSKASIIQLADRYTPILADVSIIWLDFPDGKEFEKRRSDIIAHGLGYMPISRINRRIEDIGGVAKSVLITTGGNPSSEVIHRLCNELLKKCYDGIEVHIIGKKPNFVRGSNHLHFYNPGPILETLAERVDTVITSCGTSLWDFLANRFCVGAINLVENQSRNYEYALESRQTVPIHLDNSNNSLHTSLQSLFFDANRRRQLASSTLGLYDFDGAVRCAKIIESYRFS